MQIKALIFSCMLMLSGCASKPVVLEQPDTFVHPDWPTPVQPVHIKWNAIASEDGQDVRVQMSLDDSIELRIFLEDIRRYVADMNDTLCFYRPDDERCQPLKNTK